MSKERITKRVITYKHSDSSLTSQRVSIILGSRVDSKKLAEAVRALRHSGNNKSSFKLSADTERSLEKARLKLQSA